MSHNTLQAFHSQESFEPAKVSQPVETKKVSKETKVFVVTGATRCGKTRFTKLIEGNTKAGEIVKFIHQDDYFIDPKDMPKVSLQGAPYIKVTYWDDDKCIDWAELMLQVNAAIHSSTKPDLLVVEGNMLISCKPLLKLADMVIAISIDKWTCFDRRRVVLKKDKRQHYMAYMIKMWQSHVERFEKINDDMKTVFISQTDLTIAMNREYTSALNVFYTVDKRFTWRKFLDELFRDEKYSPHHIPVVVDNKNSVYGMELATKMASKSTFANLVDHVHGMLLGVALGDASGAWCEFHHQHAVVWKDGKLNIPLVLSGQGGVRSAPPGAITDDFQMTFLVVKHLIANKFSYDSVKQVNSYIKWASSNPGGIGINTRDLFQHPPIKNEARTMVKYRTAFDSKHADKEKLSMSNGTLMRASAFAICPDRESAIENSMLDAHTSNCNLVNASANAIYVAFVHDLLHNVVGNDVNLHIDPVWMLYVENILIENEYFATYGNEEFKRVKEVVYHAVDSPFYDKKENIGDMSALVNSKDKKGFVLVALWVAFRYYRMWRHSNGPKRLSIGEVLRQVVCLGGDTDTNAAITGGMLGADVGADYLLVCESDNLEVVLNVEYQYSTVKNVDNLTPAALPKYLNKLYDLYSGTESADVEETSTSSTDNSTSTKRKNSNDDDDNDEDEETEDFDPDEVRKEKKSKQTK